ncbi:hypothetical protein F5B21DRAFT_506555 [Xylaria acuta]|nr:hypothetical protein F5B21DRAFT_506555 [Xylaria acuta]
MALGPIGALVSALAGLTLNVAGKLATSATGTEADTGKSYAFTGVAEQAILGEAAITGLKKMGNAKCKELGIFDTSTVGKAISQGLRIALPIIGSVAQAGLPLLLQGTEADAEDQGPF